ncbi:MAG: hypothetical protein K2H43_05345, partial [Clostridia bacterium]|nr:hypothetical protein [Clostridia bacterium]
FGTATVKLGSFLTKTNTVEELVWIPVYLAKDIDGDAILTLWLADSSTSAVSDQERSSWSDGTSSLTQTKTYSEGGNTYTVYSNTYDSSYVRHAILNGDNGYVKGFDSYWNGSATVSNTSGASRSPDPGTLTLNKFIQFQTGGVLSNYVVTPRQVPYQMGLSQNRNDPAYSNVNYPNNWINDKLWLPSISETASGYWNPTTDQRSSSYWPMMRQRIRQHIIWFRRFLPMEEVQVSIRLIPSVPFALHFI